MTCRPAMLSIVVTAVIAMTVTMRPNAKPHLIWNASKSIPIGLYHVQPVDRLTPASLVVAYPPEPLATYLADGCYLPHGVPLIKRVLALTGQIVCRNGRIITVDGTESGTARVYDHRGRSLAEWQGCHIIAAGEIFLMNPEEPASLDGRYFGPIPRSAVIGRAEPLWTFQKE